MSAAIKTVLALAAVGAVHAAVTPTAPGPGDSFNEGAACPIKYTIDATGTWKNMTIELMTGSNTAMVHVADVVTGFDGTTGDGTYSWTCPDVTPNSAIYFYQFTNNGADATWTTRFTIAGADGTTTKPTESTQPGGQAIPWGTGRLASGASSGGAAAGSAGAASSGTASATGTADNSTSSASGRGRGNATVSAAGASSVPTAAYGSRNSSGSSSSSAASSSSSAAAPSGSSSSSSTSGAQKMVAGFVAAVAGVVGVASLVM